MKKISNIINEAQSEETKRLRAEKNRIQSRLRSWKAKGKDTTELEKEYEAAWDRYRAAKEADKTGQTLPPQSSPVASQDTEPVPTGKKSSPSPKNQTGDWKKGYDDAVEAIRQVMSGGGQQSGGSGGSGDSGLAPIPQNPNDPTDGGQTRGQGNQGVVRPEDCAPAGAGSLSKTPGQPGGIISRSDGDKIAQAEGYDKEGGGEESTAKDWQDAARKAASKMKGAGAGYDKLKIKLDNLYRASADWKKELKKIVGQCISPDEGERRFTNKNILISQNRIARSDKDKYDSWSYMVAAIDTSGSMSEEYLRQCLADVYNVALAKKPMKIVVVQFDTRIADVKEYHSLNELKKELKTATIKGGGGTDCKCVFELFRKDPKYRRAGASECTLIFTDGYLDQYKRDPRTMNNLVWVVIDNLSFDLQYKDAHTKLVRIKSSDMN